MNHLQHSACVFIFDVASNEISVLSFLKRDLNLIRSKRCPSNFFQTMIILLYLMILILFKTELNLTTK